MGHKLDFFCVFQVFLFEQRISIETENSDFSMQFIPIKITSTALHGTSFHINLVTFIKNEKKKKVYAQHMLAVHKTI